MKIKIREIKIYMFFLFIKELNKNLKLRINIIIGHIIKMNIPLLVQAGRPFDEAKIKITAATPQISHFGLM
jgi:hypothetical protein